MKGVVETCILRLRCSQLTITKRLRIASAIVPDQISSIVKLLVITSTFGRIRILVYSFNGALAYINGHAHVARFSTGLNGYKNL